MNDRMKELAGINEGWDSSNKVNDIAREVKSIMKSWNSGSFKSSDPDFAGEQFEQLSRLFAKLADSMDELDSTEIMDVHRIINK